MGGRDGGDDMIRLPLLAALLLVVGGAAEWSLAPGIAPEPFTSDRLAVDVARLAGGNLTLEEWVVVLALGHGYTVNPGVSIFATITKE